MDYLGEIIEGLKYALPAIVTGYTTYYFLNRFYRYEEKKQLLQAKADLKRHSLPIRLQAYERLALFLERISPAKLVQNVKPDSNDKHQYELALVFQIESEFEHNLSQQIYVSNNCWKTITAAKNATMMFINQVSSNPEVKTAFDLQKALIEGSAKDEVPTNIGLSYIRNEVSELF
jgi:hypothetical protein